MIKYVNANNLSRRLKVVYERSLKEATTREERELNEAVYAVVSMMLMDAPAEDVVRVVRCRDCKYRTKDTRWTRAGYCGRRGAGDFYAAPPDGYCSYGETEEKK